MEVLKPIRGAVRAYGRGANTLACIYLAFARLPRLETAGREFCRLFFADRLLSGGVSPIELLDGLGIDAGPIRLLKASADDPKHPGWPAGTPGGLGGQFRPRGRDASGSETSSSLDLPRAAPIADFSGGFHDAVVNAWLAYFRTKGIPAIPGMGIRVIGSNSSVIGFLDIIANIPEMGGLVVIEVKTGADPPFTPSQMAYLPALQVGGHIYSTDPRLPQLGLAPGVPFPPMEVMILYAPGPGLPYKAMKLPRPEFEKWAKTGKRASVAMSEDAKGPFAVASGKLMLFMTNAIRGGVVFDRDLALRIAELLCEAHYGREELDRQKPLSLIDKDNYWRVEGSLNRDGKVEGPGEFVVSIEKYDGRVTDFGLCYRYHAHPSVVPMLQKHLEQHAAREKSKDGK